jgi:hypothetical protein
MTTTQAGPQVLPRLVRPLDREVLQVTRGELELYLRHRERRGYAAATVARRFGTVAGFYRYAVPGQGYYLRKLAEGKTRNEALHALERRISDSIHRQLPADAASSVGTGPGGQVGATLISSAADRSLMVDTSDRPQSGPVSADPTPSPLPHPRGPRRPKPLAPTPRRRQAQSA